MKVELEGLDAHIRLAVEEEVERALGAREADKWLTAPEAALYIGVAVSTIHDYVCSGALVRHGGRKTKLRFRRSELDAFVGGQR
jgi:Helix-turn-helix domain